MLASIRQWIFGSHETVHEHHGNLRHVSLVDIGPPLSYGQALLSTKETALRTAWTTLQLSSRAGGLVPIVGPGISLGLDLVVQLCQVAKDHQLIKPTIEHAVSSAPLGLQPLLWRKRQRYLLISQRYLAISALIDTVASSQGQIDRHAVGSILQEADLNEALTFNNAVANNIKRYVPADKQPVISQILHRQIDFPSIVQSLLDICEEFARRSPIAQAARFPDFRGNVKAKEDEIMFEWEKLSQQYLCRIDASAGEISAVMRRFERGLNELQATQRTTLQHIIENARENHSELMSEIATLRAETGHPGELPSELVMYS